MREYAADYTLGELMTVAAAHQIRDGDVVIVGIGYPFFAGILAKNTHAPRSTIIIESGVIDCEPIEPGIDVCDPRMWYNTTRFSGTIDALGATLHRGIADVGFIGTSQIDRYGNLNTTLFAPHGKPLKRLIGSGGANDIASLAKRVVIIMPHEKRKFADKLDYMTSPGHLNGPEARKRAGLSGLGPVRVITNKAVLGFDEKTKQLKLESMHPGVSLEDISKNTGIELLIPKSVPTTEPPTVKELEILRTKADLYE